jgi:hypothetical protein
MVKVYHYSALWRILINPPSKKCLRELVGIAGSSWREEQGRASNDGRYFAHLAGCVVAKQKISTNCLSVWATLTIKI